MKVKAAKVAQYIVEIPLDDVIDLARREANVHGSRSAGQAINIPADADWEVNKENVTFTWQEKR